MTDRIAYITVALEEDIRDDDVQPLVDAIKQMRWVQGVKVGVTNPEVWTGTERAKHQVIKSLLNLVHDLNKMT